MKQLFSLAVLCLIMSCSTKNKLYTATEEELFDQEILDTLVVTADREVPEEFSLPVFQASAERLFDLKHTKLELSFDWAQQHVNGIATLTLSPFFYETDLLILDAKNFIVHDISLDGKKLLFENTEKELWISLDKKYTRDEDLILTIDYTARPNVGVEGGSDAIQSDKGLFFINPLKEDDKPQQIWTQGETEHNSRWFPTIDKPNERCSQEMYLTVDDRFATLSNGELVSSVKNPNGTRTDYWKQELPHAPYLFMIAVGEYAVVKDSWNDLPLYYYVEKEYEQDAKAIFNDTPEMLSFFSEKLNYDYPWDKYAQVVCRDYVSGAMENTGAVIFGEFVQRSSQEVFDEPNDYIVAHEMIHHWFGNLVTCESWANLTLNEGFANYGEYLWFEHKYGPYTAENHRLNELSGYLSSSFSSELHPLIHFQYSDKEQMFDAHSYNKGGLVLHMLRVYLGDDAFFNSLAYYLKKNEFSSVEADELRMAFEDTTGKDLNWFFDQWFFNQGHPILEVNYSIDEENEYVTIAVDQVQNTKNHLSSYTLPVEVAFYYQDGSVSYHPYTVKHRSETIKIPFTQGAPELVVFDGKHDLLAVISENRPNEDYVSLFKNSNEYLDQYTAINKLRFDEEINQIVDLALVHPFHYFRIQGIKALEDEKYLGQIKDMLLHDENAEVRATAFEKLLEFDPQEAVNISQKILSQEKSYTVIGSALRTLYDLDPENTLERIDEIAENNPKPLIGLISDIYAETSDVKYLDFFKDNIERVSIYELWNFTKLYVDLAEHGNSVDMINTASALKDNIKDSGTVKKSLLMYNMGRIYKRLSNIHNLDNTDDSALKVKDMMELVILNEKDLELAEQFKAYLN